jgi:hypothetical protein
MCLSNEAKHGIVSQADSLICMKLLNREVQFAKRRLINIDN